MTTKSTKATIADDATSSEIPSDVDIRTDEERAADEELAARNRDANGATLVEAQPEGEIGTNSGAVLTPIDTPVIVAKEGEWDSVIVVYGAPARMPKKGDSKIIVAENRTQPDEKGQGGGQLDTDAVYPKSGDAYLGWRQLDEEGADINIFGDVSAPVFLVGGNLRPLGLGGVSRKPGYVSVGPAHPVYAAVNLALLQGAKKVRVTGLSDFDKAHLGPWLDKIKGEFEELSYGGPEEDAD